MRPIAPRLALLAILALPSAPPAGTAAPPDGGDFREGAVAPSVRIVPHDKGGGPLVREVTVARGGSEFFRLGGAPGRFLSRAGLVGTPGGGLRLVTVWTKGAHGEILLVHDLGAPRGGPEERLVRGCTTTSAWPMSLDLSRAARGTLVVHARTSERDELGVPGTATSSCRL